MNLNFDTTLGKDALVLTTLGSSWEILNQSPSSNEDGFDGLQLDVACLRGETDPDFAFSDWPLGSQISGKNMWVVGCRPRCAGAGIFTAQITCKGMFGTKEFKVRGGAGADQQSAEDIYIPEIGGIVKKLQTFEATPTMSVSFIRIGGSPDTDKVGLPAMSATLSPGVPADSVRASFWQALEDPTYHFPNGWILEAVDYDQIPGAAVYFETHHWSFIHAVSP